MPVQLDPLTEEKVDFARLIELIRMAGENRKVSAYWADYETALIELRDLRDPEGAADYEPSQPEMCRDPKCPSANGPFHHHGLRRATAQPRWTVERPNDPCVNCGGTRYVCRACGGNNTKREKSV